MSPAGESHTTLRGARVIHISRPAGLLLAIPVLLALGVVSIVGFVVAVTVVFLAPLLGRRGFRAAESPPEPGTITLDPSSYRKMGDDVPQHRASAPARPALPPSRSGRG